MATMHRNAAPRWAFRGARGRVGGHVFAVLLLAAGLAGASSGAASALDAPLPQSRTSSLIASAANGHATTIATTPQKFSPDGRITIYGSKTVGSSVMVTLSPGNVRACSVAADDQDTWSCAALLPNGGQQRLTAVETLSDSAALAPASVDTLIDVLGAPFLDGDGTILTAGNLTGIGFPGSTVIVSVNGTPDPGCTRAVVHPNSFWSCPLSAASGGPYTVRAQQSNPAIGAGSLSQYSNVQSVVVDRDAPAAAVIATPVFGTRITEESFTVSGTGESGATVDVYLDGTPSCSTVVVDSQFSCVLTALANGAHALRALQHDAAGNYAPPSAEIGVAFGPAPSATVPPTSPPRITTPAVPSPVPADSSPDTGAVAEPVVPDPVTVPTPSASSAAVPSSGGWGTTTGFGRGNTLPPAGPVHENWLAGPLIGLLFLALVAIPLRLLVAAVAGRMPRPRFTGRNQSQRHPATAVPASTRTQRGLRVIAPIMVTAAVIAISGGVGGEVRYLRLFLAITLGLVVLNGLTALVLRSASRLLGLATTLRWLPGMLVAAAATSLLSRLLSIDPPLIAGVLVGAVIANTASARHSAVLSLLQLGSLTVLGILAWFAHGQVANGTGFWAALTSETLATVFLAGLGSVLVLVLPLGTLPGRIILNWSSLGWTATVVVAASVSAGTIFGSTATVSAAIPWALAVAAFAGLCVVVWGFVRFVEPRLRA
ncbi:MAG: hypothetical protein H7248_00260 [Microbacteriaceae bacterium]|nr:hypothetical protein [Microbacteriaceae bacterium]